ncbi:MAG TPA: hypothetical protein VFN94_10835 [Nitrospiria bacterium]|nr:hypothetical protein [Nitrospiria bacterium]
MSIAKMDRDARRAVFRSLRVDLLRMRVWIQRPRVFLFECNPDLMVAFAIMHALLEEGAGVREFDGSLNVMVRSDLPKETV